MSQSASGSLFGALLLTVLCLGRTGGVHAQEPTVFVVPKAHPIERYEAGWNKNPFTLKTAPTVMAQDSFAKDLSIGAYYGETQDPTVWVANIKTGERIKLKKSQAAANGMQLKSVTLGGSRKDMVIEVTLGSETSEVRYNDDFMKQQASMADNARAAPAHPPGIPGQHPAAMPPGMPAKVPVRGAPPAASQLPLPVPLQGMQNRGVPNAGIAGRSMGSPVSAPMTTTSRSNINVTPNANIGNSTVSAAGAGSVPRRRLIAPASPVTIQQ